MKKKNFTVFAIFLALSFVLRLPSFFQSVIDWDESLYVLMGHSLANGKLPYIEVWDHKPPGMAVLFYLAFTLFGDSIVSIRILSCLAIALTCYFLYRLGTVIGKNNEMMGWVAGLLYAVFSLTNSGLAAKPEIFYLPFVSLAFYLLFSAKGYPDRLADSHSLRFFGIGLAMGTGLQIKQVVIFDFAAILIIVALSFYFQEKDWRKLVTSKKLLLSGTWLIYGLVAPLAVAAFTYLISGNFDDYIYANFTANAIRSTDALSVNNFAKAVLVQSIQYFLFWACLFYTGLDFSGSKSIDSDERKLVIYLTIWFSMSCLGVLYTRNFWAAYFLQLLPSLCLIGAQTIVGFTNPEKRGQRQRLALIPIITGLLIGCYFPLRSVHKSVHNIYFASLKKIPNWGDPPAAVAAYLKERGVRGNYIYVVNYEPVIYYLTGANMPTKYVFPPHLLDPHLAKVAGVNTFQEMNNILGKKPLYIIKKGERAAESRQAVYTGFEFYLKYLIESNIAKLAKQKAKTEARPQHQKVSRSELDTHLKEFYVLETSISGIELYRRKD
jgi:4-amino-4-deoxy-L-arabinose transferase-like glycosyltransferase